jgi:hypothetical protein
MLIEYRPEGTYAIITKHGEFHEVRKEGGMYFCLPWVIISCLFLSPLDSNSILSNLAKHHFRHDSQVLPHFR